MVRVANGCEVNKNLATILNHFKRLKCVVLPSKEGQKTKASDTVIFGRKIISRPIYRIPNQRPADAPGNFVTCQLPASSHEHFILPFMHRTAQRPMRHCSASKATVAQALALVSLSPATASPSSESCMHQSCKAFVVFSLWLFVCFGPQS